MLFEFIEEKIGRDANDCLNPYSNGICSLSYAAKYTDRKGQEQVLILILMEYAL